MEQMLVVVNHHLHVVVVQKNSQFVGHFIFEGVESSNAIDHFPFIHFKPNMLLVNKLATSACSVEQHFMW